MWRGTMHQRFMNWASGRGLTLDRYTGIGVTNPKRLHARLFFDLCPALIKLGVSAELFTKSIIFEFVRE
jgi:hypothetical protein